MSINEQLERVLKRSPFNQNDEKFLVVLKDMNWLITTVEEQQKEIELTKADLQVYIAKWKAQGGMIQKLHDENARLREENDKLKTLIRGDINGTDMETSKGI